MSKRQISLDTETTGIDTRDDHRIIEIGCVELINRRVTGNNFHIYLQPDRAIDEEAMQVHGITPEFLADKPRFPDIAADLIEYLRGAELVIHNAAFDVGFLNHEFSKLNNELAIKTQDICSVLDTLELARNMHPGQRNSLDALCRRYDINNAHRTLHGALLDAEILADVYLAMTGGQSLLELEGSESGDGETQFIQNKPLASVQKTLAASVDEESLAAHENYLDLLRKESGKEINSW